MSVRVQYFSGRCRCGHLFSSHHLGAIANAEVLSQLRAIAPTHPGYRAEECTHYYVNEAGGLGPDGRDHCHRYVDRDDPEQPAAPGTFTRRARALAWVNTIAMIPHEQYRRWHSRQQARRIRAAGADPHSKRSPQSLDDQKRDR